MWRVELLTPKGRGSRFTPSLAVIQVYEGEEPQDFSGLLPGVDLRFVTCTGPETLLSSVLKRYSDSGGTDGQWWTK
jgi:hypothetical protein